MKFFHNYLIISILLYVSACTINEVGPPGKSGGYDSQIRFPLGANAATTDTLRIDAQYDLIKFNKANYTDVDSIVFSSRLRSAIDQDTCYVDLYNVTDKTIISNARVIGDTTVFVWQDHTAKVKNIYANLPSKEITLGVIVRSKKKGKTVEGGQSYLFLYRRK